MTQFDLFASQIWEEAKRFFEKAKECSDANGKDAFLHSAILIGMSALEAYVNGICEEIMTFPDIPLHEKSILSEREIEFDNGEFRIADKLQMYRLTDRIEFIHFKFSGTKLNGKSHQWYADLKTSIKLRNSLVHPKDAIRINEGNVKILMESIMKCLLELSKAVYKKPFPFISLELQSKLTF